MAESTYNQWLTYVQKVNQTIGPMAEGFVYCVMSEKMQDGSKPILFGHWGSSSRMVEDLAVFLLSDHALRLMQNSGLSAQEVVDIFSGRLLREMDARVKTGNLPTPNETIRLDDGGQSNDE